MAPLRPDHRKTQPSGGETRMFKVSRQQSSKAKQKQAKQAKRLIDSLADLQNTDVFTNANANDADKARIGGLETSEASNVNSIRLGAIRDMFKNIDPKEKNITQKEVNQACQAFSSRQAIQATKDTSRWRLRGLKTKLLFHQVLGTAWMREREKGERAPYGGILADQMGFGKTIQMIANMVDDLCIGQHPLTDETKAARRGMTLVVTPSTNLAKQWEEEFLDHCDSSKLRLLERVARYHAGQRSDLKGEHLIRSLKKNCVIITTYSELSKQFKEPAKAPPLETYQEQVLREGKAKNQTGPFFQIDWRRVVLDEAHTIKNHNSHVSKACCALKSKFRWMMTATPLFNNPDEFYAYLKFLELPGITSFRSFRKQFFDENLEDSCAELRLELSHLMLRRTEQHTLLGTALVPLHDCEVNTIPVDLSPSEKRIYEKLDLEVAREVGTMVEEEDNTKDKVKALKHNALLKIMRLRLAVCHPLFVAHKVMAEPSTRGESRESTAESSELSPEEMNELLQAGTYPKTLSPNELLHMRSTLKKWADDYSQRENAYEVRLLSEEEIQDRRVLRKRLFGNEAFKYKTKRWMEMGFPVILSTKARAVLKQILEWIADDPGRKIVVFTQFLEMISVLKKTLAQYNIGCETYHGKMSSSSRSKALARFGDEVEKKVLLMSLFSGGFGLNLMCASRVINVDIWWNGCSEAQAFGRVRRLGQKRKTEFVRFAVRGTIDERLLELQGIKYGKVFSAMSENAIKKKFITLEEVIKLAGPAFRSIEITKGNMIDEDDEDDDLAGLESEEEGDDDDDSGDEDDENIEDVASTTSTDEWDFVEDIENEDVSVHGEDHNEASVKEET